MQSLPLKYKLVLAPAVVIIPVIFVILLMLSYLNTIGQQNDSVRNWAHITDLIRISITSGKRLDRVAQQLPHSNSSENEELTFNYIELSRLLNGSLTDSALRNNVDKKILTQLQELGNSIKFKEKMDFSSVSSSLDKLIPKLELLFSNLQATKRAIYIDSNQYVKDKTAAMARISVSVLALCVFLGIIFSLWITKSTTAKIKQLAKNANFVCDLSHQDTNENKKFDDLEDIALCLSIMSNRMLSTIAAEKLLQGVEDERSRIAMDIHDQFLSDLNIFKRTLNQKFIDSSTTPLNNSDVNEINATLDELAFTLRGIIDDLHPQTLDMFGLEAAIQSYLDRKLSSDAHPAYYINIDSEAEKQLSPFQKLSLFRILLESIQNIIRHAHCNRYEIDLRMTDSFLILTIDDNGVGMNKYADKRGHGIFNITQRAYSIKAQIQWNTSRFSSGTQVLLKLPLQFINTDKNSPLEIPAPSYVQTV